MDYLKIITFLQQSRSRRTFSILVLFCLFLAHSIYAKNKEFYPSVFYPKFMGISMSMEQQQYIGSILGYSNITDSTIAGTDVEFSNEYTKCYQSSVLNEWWSYISLLENTNNVVTVGVVQIRDDSQETEESRSSNEMDNKHNLTINTNSHNKKTMFSVRFNETESNKKTKISPLEDCEQSVNEAINYTSDIHWYSDDEVNEILEYYLGPKLGNGLMHAISIEQDAGNTLAESLSAREQQLRQLAEQTELHYPIIILPINLGNHWVALYIDRGDLAVDNSESAPMIAYIDPLGHSMPENLRQILLMQYPGVGIKNIADLGIKFQEDYWNCGPWIIEILKQLVYTAGSWVPAANFDISVARAEQQAVLSHDSARFGDISGCNGREKMDKLGKKSEETVLDIEDIKVNKIQAHSIITPSKLPGSDYVINPYVGCGHGCKYCYARFMKRFTGHEEEWGHFIDVKLNAVELIPRRTNAKFSGKTVTCSSVTDPYQPLESKYCLTRNILKKLVVNQPKLNVITKSPLVLRDIDILKKFKSCRVLVSLSLLDDSVRRQLEPGAGSVYSRLNTLEKLHDAGIYTILFVAPILPHFTDWRSLIIKTKSFVDEYFFENLNMYPSIRGNINKFLKAVKPELIVPYSRIYSAKSSYWENEEKAMKDFCKKLNVNCKFYFHHKT